MPSSSDTSVKVSLRPSVLAAVKKQARDEGVSLPEYFADLATDDLIAKNALKPGDADSLLAERDLLKRVREIVDAIKAKDDWTEHVTNTVFEKIRLDHPELHARAIGSDFAAQVNRRIGALVKRRLGAHDRKIKGKPVMANVSRRSPSLIKTYTLLYREPQETIDG